MCDTPAEWEAALDPVSARLLRVVYPTKLLRAFRRSDMLPPFAPSSRMFRKRE